LINLAWILDVVKSVEIGTILVLSSLIVLFIIVCLLQCYGNINLHLVYFDYMSSVVTILLLSSCICSYSVYPKVPRVDDLHYVGVVLRYISYL
jgi:hypothetical protein